MDSFSPRFISWIICRVGASSWKCHDLVAALASLVWTRGDPVTALLLAGIKSNTELWNKPFSGRYGKSPTSARCLVELYALSWNNRWSCSPMVLKDL